MGLVSAVKSMFTPKKAKPNGLASVRSSYDAASDTRFREKYFENAKSGDADSDLLPELATLRNRARYEIRNNPYARGMMLTWANYVIGNGLQVQMRTDNEKFNEAFEKMFASWSQHADAAGRYSLSDMLHLGEQQIFPCGEYFMVRTMDESMPDIPALRYLMIEPDRVATPYSSIYSNNTEGGITTGTNGQVEKYHINKRHPEQTISVSFDISGGFNTYTAEKVIHVMNVTRPGQTRGESKMCAMIPLSVDFRKFRMATVMAAEQAALFSAYIQTNDPATEVTNDDPLILDIEPATITTLPSGYNIAQINPHHPATTFEMFSKQILGEMGASVNMPFNVVAMNSSGYNYASGRQDWQVFHRSITGARKVRERVAFARIIHDFLAEFRRMTGNQFPPQVWQDAETMWLVLWPGFEHVDPLKEANAEKTRLENNTDTLADIWAKKGGQWADKLKQRKAEKAMLELLGMTDEDALPDAEDEDDDEEDEKDDEK